eukprot:117474-Pyramimonas_sp.AAC.1
MAVWSRPTHRVARGFLEEGVILEARVERVDAGRVPQFKRLLHGLLSPLQNGKAAELYARDPARPKRPKVKKSKVKTPQTRHGLGVLLFGDAAVIISMKK